MPSLLEENVPFFVDVGIENSIQINMHQILKIRGEIPGSAQNGVFDDMRDAGGILGRRTESDIEHFVVVIRGKERHPRPCLFMHQKQAVASCIFQELMLQEFIFFRYFAADLHHYLLISYSFYNKRSESLIRRIHHFRQYKNPKFAVQTWGNALYKACVAWIRGESNPCPKANSMSFYYHRRFFRIAPIPSADGKTVNPSALVAS